MQNLLYHPAPRVAPPEIIGRLRAIHPRVDLHYYGIRPFDDGRKDPYGRPLLTSVWALGVTTFNRSRWQRHGELALKLGRNLNPLNPEHRAHLPRLDRLRAIARLESAGFYPLKLFEQNDADDRIVAWFEVAHWVWRTNPDQAFQAALAESDGTAPMARKLKRLLDATVTHGAHAWRSRVRRPVYSHA